jgi:hypothetical protein
MKEIFDTDDAEAENIQPVRPKYSDQRLGGHNAAISRRTDDSGPLEIVVNHLSQKVTDMNAHIQSIDDTNIQQDHDIQLARASTFVRWGNVNCSTGSEMVYSGVIGGSSHTDTGAATNYLCLTMSPIAGPFKTYGANLRGAEYATKDQYDNFDPVCAVCRVTFATTIMIPGTNVCTPGWHLQYSGYLMAGGSGHVAGTEYICVDSALESILHSDQDQNGKLLFYVHTVCGSLPCGPYQSNKTVTCAICSK